MKLIIGAETGWGWLERATYRGAIGLFYDDTWSGLLAYLIVGLICLLAVIGLITVIRLIFRPRKRKMTSTGKWMKTGKL